MSLGHSPSIVTDGLVMYLDVANQKSFRGVPTTNLYASNGFDYWQMNGNHTATRVVGVAPGLDLSTNYDYHTVTATGAWSAETNRVILWNLNASSAYTQGTQYAFSFYARTTSVSRGTIGAAFYGNSINNQFNLTSSWQRFIGVSTPNTSFRGFEFGAVGGALTFQIAGFQIEAQPSATPYVNSVRGATVATGGGWADLTNNSNNGDLVNSPTYSSSNQGSLVFNGTNNYITSIFSTLSGQGVTYAGWLFSTETTATYKNFIDSVSQRPMIWWNASGQIEFDSTMFTTTQVYRNQWVYVALSKPSGSSIASYYVNGVLAGNGTAYVTPAITPTFFNRGTTQAWNGRCAMVQVYNRALTATEINQNFNATRGRFLI